MKRALAAVLAGAVVASAVVASCSPFSAEDPVPSPDLEAGVGDASADAVIPVDGPGATDASADAAHDPFCKAPTSQARAGEVRFLCTDFDDGRGLAPWLVDGVTLDPKVSSSPANSALAKATAGSQKSVATLTTMVSTSLATLGLRLVFSVLVDVQPLSVDVFTLVALGAPETPISIAWKKDGWYLTGGADAKLTFAEGMWNEIVIEVTPASATAFVNGASATIDNGASLQNPSVVIGVFGPINTAVMRSVHLDNIAFFVK